MASESDVPMQRVAHLSDLGRMEPQPVGRRVYVDEDGISYTCAGNTTPEIAQRIGWTLANVWIPSHVLSDIRGKRGRLIPDPITVAAVVLLNPIGVWKDEQSDNAVRFVANADILRDRELLQSASTRHVDTIVELRQVPSGNLLRLFHLSPTTKAKGTDQLWP